MEAITHRDDKSMLIPQTHDDWREWVSATATRNFVLNDPILDWLDQYGEQNGFQPDTALEQYDPRTSFIEFIFIKGNEFESAVIGLLKQKYEITQIADTSADLQELEFAKRTFAAMADGAPIIYQGVLMDPQHRTYGAPDLLVRSDVLAQMFPQILSAEEAATSAPDLGQSDRHYRVVDIKFHTLGLLVSGESDNTGSAPAYKAQLFVYNQALGRLQGFEPPSSYLIGRGWRQGKDRGTSCLETLGQITQNGTVANKYSIGQLVSDATNWVRRLRSEGANWRVLPSPSVPQLYPDAGNQSDEPWHVAKRKIAEDLKELTRLWQVGVPGRRNAHQAGLFYWDDPSLTLDLVKVTGDKRSRVLTELLTVNRDPGPVVRPIHISAEREVWHQPEKIEFYVDFEFVSDLSDDFTHMPEKGGQPLIFMIGCGHLEDTKWFFKSFTVETLSEVSEAKIIDEWIHHMETVRVRVGPDVSEPTLFHWSPAEVTNFQNAYNSAKDRHPTKDWPSLRWFDFLGKVVREEPVVVKGAFGFGLKAVSSALHSEGLIETLWGDGPSDGLGAMVAAWWCDAEAKNQNVQMSSIDLMREVIEYNEVDCKVMMEIIGYLRANH